MFPNKTCSDNRWFEQINSTTPKSVLQMNMESTLIFISIITITLISPNFPSHKHPYCRLTQKLCRLLISAVTHLSLNICTIGIWSIGHIPLLLLPNERRKKKHYIYQEVKKEFLHVLKYNWLRIKWIFILN